MKKSAIPNFARSKPVKGEKPAPTDTKSHVPDPRQPAKAPTKSKNGGRRGT
jgi:hypothetical protein